MIFRRKICNSIRHLLRTVKYNSSYNSNRKKSKSLFNLPSVNQSRTERNLEVYYLFTFNPNL